MYSELFQLGKSDFTKGLVVAILSAIFPLVSQALQGVGFAFDWQQILKVAVVAFLGYMLKNFLSDSSGKVLGRIG